MGKFEDDIQDCEECGTPTRTDRLFEFDDKEVCISCYIKLEDNRIIESILRKKLYKKN